MSVPENVTLFYESGIKAKIPSTLVTTNCPEQSPVQSSVSFTDVLSYKKHI